MSINVRSTILAERLETLTELTKDKDHTQSDKKQAKSIGIPYQTFRKYLNNKAECSIGFLCQIAEYYNVSTDYLLVRTDVKSTDTEIQSVCDYLELPEKTIKALKQIGKANSLLSEYDHKEQDVFILFNELIQSKTLLLILAQILMLKKDSQKLIDSIDNGLINNLNDFTKLDNECILRRAALERNIKEWIDIADYRVIFKPKYDKLQLELMDKAIQVMDKKGT